MDRATLLLVEDDPLTRSFLADNLTADGYELLVCGTVRDALRALEYHRPDLAVIDVRLPDGSGLDVIRASARPMASARGWTRRFPSSCLSGCAGDGGPESAASSSAPTTTCPSRSAIQSCGLRIGAVLRRTRERMHRGRLRVGELEIDPASRIATLRGPKSPTRAKEYALLRRSPPRPRRCFTKEELPKRRVGLPLPGADAHAGLARLPRPPQARARRGPVRRQRLGRRLPAHRWSAE
jgi:hypothetical protein